MAAMNDSNKRKRTSSFKPDLEKTQIKKPKSPASSNKSFDKSLKSSKNEPAAKFNKFQKFGDNVEKTVPKTKKEARILAKVSTFYLPMCYFYCLKLIHMSLCVLIIITRKFSIIYVYV